MRLLLFVVVLAVIVVLVSDVEAVLVRDLITEKRCGCVDRAWCFL